MYSSLYILKMILFYFLKQNKENNFFKYLKLILFTIQYFFIYSALLFIIVASENAQTSYYSSSIKTNETSETDNNTKVINMGVDDLDTTIPITELYDLHKLEVRIKIKYVINIIKY